MEDIMVINIKYFIVILFTLFTISSCSSKGSNNYYGDAEPGISIEKYHEYQDNKEQHTTHTDGGWWNSTFQWSKY